MYHKLIKEKVKILEDEIEKIKKQQPAIEIAEEYKKTLYKSTVKNLSYCVKVLSICVHDTRVAIFPKTKEDITKALRFFGRHRYSTFNKYEVPEDRYKVWQLRNKNNGLIIELAAYFYEERQSCKYVQKGEKTTPVYELVCE